MAEINKILNGEAAPSVRDKLNEVIDKVNAQAVVVPVGDAPVFDPAKAGGYPAGSIVSYRNEASPDTQFQTFAIYVANSDIPVGLSPEDSAEWLHKGTEYIIQSGSTSTIYVRDIDGLRELQEMKTGESVIVQNEYAIYTFFANLETGIKPYIQGVGSWVRRKEISLSNLVYIFDSETAGNDIGLQIPVGGVILFFHNAGGFRWLDNEGATLHSIALTEPSIISRTGAGNTLSDFTILPIFGGGGGHVIQNAAGTDMPTQPALQFGAGFTVTDEVGKTVVGNTAASHIDGANEEKHTTNQIIQQLELLKLNLPANSPLHTILQSIDNFLAGTLNTDEIDDGGWGISEKRLAILENTINGIQIQGAALLLDIFAPPGVEASLRDNIGWVNETKTLTGDNSTGQLGQKGAMIWLNDAVYAQCVSAVLEVSGSATYKRNRAVDVLDPANNTQDAAIANELDPSYTYPAMTPTGNSTDDGWNLTSQVKVITGKPTRWGMWFIGGMNGDGYTYHCFLVSGTTSYWKRTGMPSSISRCIYAATHPNLTTNLLAHDFGTGAYTQISGDEVTYADQTFYDATTRKYFIKMINGNWEKIR